MTSNAWRRLTVALAAITVMSGFGSIAVLLGGPNELEALRGVKPWAWVSSAMALLTWLSGEAWRARLRQDWAAIDRVNHDLARERYRRPQ